MLPQNQTTEVKMALHAGLWRVCFFAGTDLTCPTRNHPWDPGVLIHSPISRVPEIQKLTLFLCWSQISTWRPNFLPFIPLIREPSAATISRFLVPGELPQSPLETVVKAQNFPLDSSGAEWAGYKKKKSSPVIQKLPFLGIHPQPLTLFRDPAPISHSPYSLGTQASRPVLLHPRASRAAG